MRSSGSSETATATVQAPPEAAEVKAVLFDMVGGLGARVAARRRAVRDGGRECCVLGRGWGMWAGAMHGSWAAV